LKGIERYLNPVIGNMPIWDLSKADVVRALSPMWHDHPHLGFKLLGRIASIIDFCVQAGHREERPTIAVYKHNYETVFPKQSKIKPPKPMNALPYEELPAFFKLLSEWDDPKARCLELLVSNMMRTTECMELLWSEVDLKKALISIPGERMKGGELHEIPISPASVALLKHLKEKAEEGEVRVFLGLEGTCLINFVQKSCGLNRPDITVHGFRSTCADLLGEETDYSQTLIDLCWHG
jgi:integrase